MKCLFLAACLSVVSISASSLSWEDVAKVPAIKVAKDQYQTCAKKSWYIITNEDEVREKRIKNPKLCSSKSFWGASDDVEPIVILSAQQIADIQIGSGIQAVGMMANSEKSSYANTPNMLLFYK